MSEQVNREVRIINNSTNNREKVQTNATTLGELKQQDGVGDLLSGDVKIIVRETRNSLDVDDAELPSGGFTLFVLAKKVKSGRGDIYDQMGYNELRQECAARDNISTDKYYGKGHTMEGMRQALRADDARKEQSNGVETATEDVSDQVLELQARIDSVLEEHKRAAREEINQIVSEYGDLAADELFEEFESEISSLRSTLPEVE